ncbi:MAG TPA: hypothetical protein VM029_18450 [Opitutaceae bacterium]|nr:hypothetical protein [Opitutaceae bacterium]
MTDRAATSCRAIDIAIGILICIGVAIASLSFRAGHEPAITGISSANVGATGINVARKFRPVAVVDGRAGFQALLANLRAENEAGADRLKRLQRLAESQPSLAIDLAMALAGSDDERAAWVTELTRAWAGRDAQAAWDWLGQQMARMEPVAGSSLIGVVLDEMAARAPERVRDNVDALLRRGDIDGAIPALVACQLGLNALLARGNLDVAKAAVEEWIQNPRAQAIDASAFNVVAGAIAQNSWDDAAAWLQTLPPSIDRNSAFAVLASKWADRDPIAALKWAETLSADYGQFGAIRTVFADWVERDGSRVGDWLLGYIDRAKSESEVDQLIGSFVTFSSGLQRDPALAMQWVGLMRDSAQRQISTVPVIARWGRQDVAAATRYVDTAPGLSTAERLNLKAVLVALGVERDPMDDWPTR